MRFTFFLAVVAMLVPAAPARAGQAAPVQLPSQPMPAVPPAPAVNPDAYVLGVNDEVDITVFNRSDTKVSTRISEDGTVTFPFIGNVRAQGETPRTLAAVIAGKLQAGGFFNNPIVNVTVRSFISNSVTVFGNVNQPGVLPLDRPLTLAMMIARAGGVRSDAATYAVLRHRNGEGEQKILFADLSEVNGSGVLLKAGDTIYVPQADQFFVYGQVNAPGQFVIQTGMTVRQALARAGGPTLGGSEKKVSLYRNGKLTKKIPLDEPVQPNDVLRVGERLF